MNIRDDIARLVWIGAGGVDQAWDQVKNRSQDAPNRPNDIDARASEAWKAADLIIGYLSSGLSAQALFILEDSEMVQEQSCLDAAAAVEGVAQELDAIGRSASAKMLRNALDVLLGIEPDKPLPPYDDATRRAVAHAWARFQKGITGNAS